MGAKRKASPRGTARRAGKMTSEGKRAHNRRLREVSRRQVARIETARKQKRITRQAAVRLMRRELAIDAARPYYTLPRGPKPKRPGWDSPTPRAMSPKRRAKYEAALDRWNGF